MLTPFAELTRYARLAHCRTLRDIVDELNAGGIAPMEYSPASFDCDYARIVDRTNRALWILWRAGSPVTPTSLDSALRAVDCAALAPAHN